MGTYYPVNVVFADPGNMARTFELLIYLSFLPKKITCPVFPRCDLDSGQKGKNTKSNVKKIEKEHREIFTTPKRFSSGFFVWFIYKGIHHR